MLLKDLLGHCKLPLSVGPLGAEMQSPAHVDTNTKQQANACTDRQRSTPLELANFSYYCGIAVSTRSTKQTFFAPHAKKVPMPGRHMRP
jgi:hypothetical protein